MKRSEAFPSKYLSKDDVPQPITATIQSVTLDTLNGDNGEETKPVMYFSEPNIKAMILNNANWNNLEAMYGDESDQWIGHTVTIFVDPTVMFGKKRVGGLRVQYQAPVAKPVAPAPAPEGSGNGKGATTLKVAPGFDLPAFRSMLVLDEPHYAMKDGATPNPFHITKTILKLGFTELNDGNANEVLLMLKEYAKQEKEPTPA